MSITIAEILKLPSMNGAEVLAGRGGLHRPVESVSVLEYGDVTEKLEQFFQNNPFEGNELVITAFASIRSDVDAQCANIRRYHSVGAVGFVLYYVGILMPEVSPRLIRLCDELDFPLICMPRGKLNLRYSEAIGEIMFEVFHQRQREGYFVSDLLDRMSGLPPHQRNVDTLLRMLSDHLHVSVILTDPTNKDLTAVFWPRALEESVSHRLEGWLAELGGGSQLKVSLGERTGHLQRCPHLSSDPADYSVCLLKYGEPAGEDALWQSGELIRLFLHIWNKDHGKFVTSEIVRAIINDQVVQMNRLAKLFHIDVSQLNQMWLFHPRSPGQKHDDGLIRRLFDQFQRFSDPVLISYYEENLVVFTHASQRYDERSQTLEAMGSLLAEQAAHHDIVCFDCLATTADVRQAYLDSTQFVGAARKLYPSRQVLRASDILFAGQCQQILADGKNASQYLRLLSQLEGVNPVLLPTAEAYLLDASSNMAQAAKLLFVHLNTVKYRLHLIQDLLGYVPGKMPDAFPLYLAVALHRLMND